MLTSCSNILFDEIYSKCETTMNNQAPLQMDAVFDIVQSLPASSHSIGLVNKSPAMAFDQSSMYFPDYGGVLEIPSTSLKTYGFLKRLPFQAKPMIGLISPQTLFSRGMRHTPRECLIAIPNLNSCDSNQYSMLRAIGSEIFTDFIKKASDKSSFEFEATQCSTLTMLDPILGLKYYEGPPKVFAVRFNREVKLMKIPETGLFPTESEEISDIHIHTELASTELDNHLTAKDVALNCHNKRLLTVGCDGSESRELFLFDITKDTNQPLQKLRWLASEDESPIALNENYATAPKMELRKRRLIYRPVEDIRRGIQQLDCIPSHLVNVLVTTDHRTLIFDPRVPHPASYLVDRAKLESLLPIEYLCRFQFSPNNQHQFYSLSNVQLRVFDYRYPLMPMNQVSHMLDSDLYENLMIKVVRNSHDSSDTLCISSGERLCWLSFDQSQQGKFVNPQSTHMPYHECNESDRLLQSQEIMHGLDICSSIASDQSSQSFWVVFQLLESGKVSVRKYTDSQSVQEAHQDRSTQITMLTEDELSEKVQVLAGRARLGAEEEEEVELEPRDVLVSSMEGIEDGSLQLDILDSSLVAGIETKFESKRAHERFRKMISKI